MNDTTDVTILPISDATTVHLFLLVLHDAKVRLSQASRATSLLKVRTRVTGRGKNGTDLEVNLGLLKSTHLELVVVHQALIPGFLKNTEIILGITILARPILHLWAVHPHHQLWPEGLIPDERLKSSAVVKKIEKSTVPSRPV